MHLNPDDFRSYAPSAPSPVRRWETSWEHRVLYGGGGWHKAAVSDCLPLAAPIGLSPLLILTLCGPQRVLIVSTEPPDDLSCTGGGISPRDHFATFEIPKALGRHNPCSCGEVWSCSAKISPGGNFATFLNGEIFPPKSPPHRYAFLLFLLHPGGHTTPPCACAPTTACPPFHPRPSPPAISPHPALHTPRIAQPHTVGAP